MYWAWAVVARQLTVTVLDGIENAVDREKEHEHGTDQIHGLQLCAVGTGHPAVQRYKQKGRKGEIVQAPPILGADATPHIEAC